MNRTRHTNAFLSLVFLSMVLVTNSACAPREREEKELRCSPPLEKVISGPEEVLIYPATTSDWRSLVVLPAVEDIRYAVTFDQARRLWGAPTEVSQGLREREETYISVDRKVSVVWSRQYSGNDAFESWYLYVYPRNATVEESFHRALVQCLASEASSRRLIIMDPLNRRPALQAEVSDGHVESFLWFPPPPPATLPPPRYHPEPSMS